MHFSPIALHLPDGFLSPVVAAAGWLVALLVLWRSLRLTRRELGSR
ncbi:MAG: cobalamin biosynthesis protein CbiM, partial [Anaerolineae bacterium]|nr:cobalamin biosynthesis protein CbiM [Anaerolineae bacterium]